MDKARHGYVGEGCGTCVTPPGRWGTALGRRWGRPLWSRPGMLPRKWGRKSRVEVMTRLVGSEGREVEDGGKGQIKL